MTDHVISVLGQVLEYKELNTVATPASEKRGYGRGKHVMWV